MKATFPDGTVFEGTTEEFVSIREHSAAAGNGHKPEVQPTKAPELWTEKKARAFWDSLDIYNSTGRQQKVIRFLIKNGGRATENEVWKYLGIEKGQELAGVLANITRNARREAKDDRVRVVRWTHDGKGYHYYIPEDILQFLKPFSEK
jgi:hypothetical protein